MTGTQLKEHLSRTGYTITSIAELIGTTQSNMSASLKVADVKTGLLERICEVLNLDMSFFYPDLRSSSPKPTVLPTQSADVAESNRLSGSEREELTRLRSLNMRLTEQNLLLTQRLLESTTTILEPQQPQQKNRHDLGLSYYDQLNARREQEHFLASEPEPQRKKA